jgi:hypothetical protein
MFVQKFQKVGKNSTPSHHPPRCPAFHVPLNRVESWTTVCDTPPLAVFWEEEFCRIPCISERGHFSTAGNQISVLPIAFCDPKLIEVSTRRRDDEAFISSKWCSQNFPEGPTSVGCFSTILACAASMVCPWMCSHRGAVLRCHWHR